ncbi:hypothetical protein E1292_14730 [Nonomuraea deserti]|uniref:Core-binding (CB) domain-containing protein n=1 Tax=Nonomuraea deserti TaxID=1848322 RepID=A0A4R4VLY3_9ACTN|nr:hypothetical protein [Nonomuraea deserti]TDD06808.1 hypothetical protein E1292_14730 [Nonomuraea deserti]
MVKAATDGRYPVRVAGPLAGLVHEFRLELIRQGFTPRTAQGRAYVLAHLSRWLEQEGVAPTELSAERIAAFAAARQAGGCRRWRTDRSLRPMLGYLRVLGLVPPEEPPALGPVDAVLERYRSWLEHERRLGEQTVSLRLHWAAKFLIPQVEGGRLELGRIAPQAVTAFVLEMSQHYGSAR